MIFALDRQDHRRRRHLVQGNDLVDRKRMVVLDEMKNGKVVIDAKYIRDRISDIVKDRDLSRYIL